MAMRILALVLFLAGCTTVHQPPPGPNIRQRIAAENIAWYGDSIPIVRFSPPFIYAVWRLQVEGCAGKTRDGWPKFYIAPVNPLGTRVLALYVHASNSIVFALGEELQDWVVRHELLHFLLNGEGPGQHPVEYFGAPPIGDQPAVQGKCTSLITPQG
jgi:hypothetical protein